MREATDPGRGPPPVSDLVAGMVGLAAVSLLFGIVVLSVNIVHAHDDSRQVVPVDIPPAPARSTWHDQQGAFSAKLQRGFGLGAGVATEFAGWILEASARQDLEPDLLASVVMVESSFRKHARSVVGAIGPAQVRPHMWIELCGGDLHDPEQNVYCGALVLRHYWDMCLGNPAGAGTSVEACALGAYNVGYHNRDDIDYVDAVGRYLSKIYRFREPLRRS